LSLLYGYNLLCNSTAAIFHFSELPLSADRTIGHIWETAQLAVGCCILVLVWEA
jgi:hypothetical protein